jgi:LuxR family maltose regulon positive regulatory protein
LEAGLGTGELAMQQPQPDDLSTFDGWLKRRRRALRLTQDELAARVGCTPSMLQKIEQGARRPSHALAERLIDALGAPPAAHAPLLRLALGAGGGAAQPALETGAPEAQPGAGAAAPPLLLTKILPPPLRRQIVARPRLAERLRQAMEGGVALVVAPAGWGKTTLLASGLAESGLKVAWLALDEHDADVAAVLRYVVAALQRQVPSVGRAALDLLETPQPSADAALTLLINDLIVRDAPIALVLDDYHRVRAPAVHQAIAHLIEHLPPTLRLVLSTREDPPLPLARLRARRRLHEIRAADLRFTAGEAATFFESVMGLALAAPEVAALERRTEGWITGLQLAALALRDHADRGDFIKDFTGTHRLVLDYLAEEVLSNLPAHLHEFLLQTSVLDRMCGPLCDTVLGLTPPKARVTSGESGAALLDRPPSPDSYSQLVLDQLERVNLFVVPLDGQRRWYRYHHLFAAVLRQRLERGAPPGAVAALHERASAWFAAHGLVPEAADHALAAGQWPRAAQLVEQLGDALLQSGGVERLRQLIGALPPAAREGAPRLLYLHARCVRQVFEIPAGRALFEQAAAAFGRAGDAAGRAVSLAMLSDCCRMLADYSEAHRALDEALAGPLPPAQRAVALLSRAYEVMAADEWAAIVPTISQMLDQAEQSQDLQALHDIATNYTSLFAFLPGGCACLGRLRRLIARQPVPPLSMMHAADLFFAGLMRLIDGDVRAAEALFGRLIDLNAQINTLSQVSIEGPLWACHSAALCGDVAAAEQRMQGLMALMEQPALAAWREQSGTFFLATQCLINWAQGRADAVRASIELAEARANSHEWAAIARVRRLMRALALLDEKSWPAAERELAASFDQQRRQRESVPFGDAGMLLAHLYHQTGREPEALATLGEALALHERHGTPGLALLVGAPTIAPLLRLALARGVRSATAARLLDALPPSPPPPAQHSDPDALTARELEVLQLIATGLTNAEIAAHLVVSTSTIKKHVNNLFAKLGAQSRTQAIARARERALL